MKNKYSHKRLILILCSAMSLFYGCKDANENARTGTHLDSFGPSGVLHGQDISFIGVGLDKVTSIIMPPNIEVPQSAFKSQTSEQIVLTVPIETTTGKVTLKTPQGDIVTKTPFGPTVTIVLTTMTAEAKPGTDITLTGEFLNFVKLITFSKGKVVTKFESQSRTQLVVKVPMDAQTGTIVLSDSAKTDPQLVESSTSLIVTMPTVSGVTPMVKHSENLTITGTDLDLVSGVTFPGGTTVASFVSQAPESLVVVVPNSASDGVLTLMVPSGLKVVTTQSVSIILPKATSFSADSSPGVDLTITGTDLDLVKDILFPGGATVSVFTSQSPTQIIVTIPASAVGGTMRFRTIHDVLVSVTVPFGNQDALLYTVYDDAFQGAWQDWGWGGPDDPANTEQVKSGTKSFKKTYSAYEGIKMENTGTAVPVASYVTINASIFGGPGTNGQNVRLVVNGSYGVYPTFTIVEGQWKDFQATFAQVNNPTSISEIVFQSEFSGVIYVDKVGFK